MDTTYNFKDGALPLVAESAVEHDDEFGMQFQRAVFNELHDALRCAGGHVNRLAVEKLLRYRIFGDGHEENTNDRRKKACVVQ